MFLIRLSGFIILSISMIILSGCNPFFNTITGSGHVIAFVESISDFKSIRVSDACKLNVSYGANFSVVINTDDNMREYMEVFKSGDELTIQMRNQCSYTHYTARVDITMPSVKNISVSDASGANISGFSDSTNVILTAEDASIITGNLTCNNLGINLSDASTVELSGNSKSLQLDLTDASSATLNTFKSETVVVYITDASRASISVSGSISGTVEDASALHYRGTASSSVKSDLSSDVKHL